MTEQDADKISSAQKTLGRARALQQAKEAEQKAKEEADAYEKAKAEASRKESLGKRAKRGLVIVCTLAACLMIVALAGSGSVNLAVLSESGRADDQSVAVSAYKGDVSALLTDGDASNDPEPLETHEMTVGKRTTFGFKGFGLHTIAVRFIDDAAGFADPEPMVVNMIWIDQRQTIMVE